MLIKIILYLNRRKVVLAILIPVLLSMIIKRINRIKFRLGFIIRIIRSWDSNNSKVIIIRKQVKGREKPVIRSWRTR